MVVELQHITLPSVAIFHAFGLRYSYKVNQ